MSARLGGLASLGIWLSIGACGAADTTVDPGDFALRDLLGVAPKVAAAWDDDQRAAARAVLASALRDDEAVELAEVVAGGDDALVVRTLALTDLRLDDTGHDALGLVALPEPAPTRAAVALAGPATTAVLRGEPAAPPVAIDVDAQAWPCPHGPCALADLRGLAALATDAAPTAALVRVRPVVQLASIAALVAGADGVPVLLVNPIVTAVGLGADGEAAPGAPAAASVAPAPLAAAPPPPPLVTGTWTYGSTLGQCASTVQSECGTCLGGGLCESVWPTISGMDACVLLDADPGRNYALVCINLAVSLADVRACLLDRGSSCAVDATALDTPAGLEGNASFLDNGPCAEDLQICLDQLYGSGTGSSDGCGSCSGCDGCNDNSSNGSCNNNDNSNCNSCDGNGCSGNGGGCGNGGSGGSCSIAQPSSHSPGLALGLAWVLVPLPVALRARRRARRGRARGDADPA